MISLIVFNGNFQKKCGQLLCARLGAYKFDAFNIEPLQLYETYYYL